MAPTALETRLERLPDDPNVRAAAQALGVSLSTIRRWAASGRLPPPDKTVGEKSLLRPRSIGGRDPRAAGRGRGLTGLETTGAPSSTSGPPSPTSVTPSECNYGEGQSHGQGHQRGRRHPRR